MALDVNVYLEGDVVTIEAGPEWTLQRKSDEIGDIFCKDEYVFVEDYQLGVYQVFAPEAVEETVLQGDGPTIEQARADLEAAIEQYRANFGVVQYDISGTLAFDSPNTDD